MGLIVLVLQIYQLVLLAYVIFSWVPSPPDPLMPAIRGVRGLVDPVLTPIRRVMPTLPLGGVQLDLSIIVLFIGTSILISVLS